MQVAQAHACKLCGCKFVTGFPSNPVVHLGNFILASFRSAVGCTILLWKLASPKNPFNCVLHWAGVPVGSGHSRMAFVLEGSMVIPLSLMTWSRKLMEVIAKVHLKRLTNSLCCLRSVGTARKCARCSSGFLEYTSTSSKYTSTKRLMCLLKTSFMSRWKVAGALHNPKSKTLNW